MKTILSCLAALVLLLCLSGCSDDAARNAAYTGQDLEFQGWSENERSQIIDSISQAYNRQTGIRNEFLNGKLKNSDSDIYRMNERYSQWQNFTRQAGF